MKCSHPIRRCPGMEFNNREDALVPGIAVGLQPQESMNVDGAYFTEAERLDRNARYCGVRRVTSRPTVAERARRQFYRMGPGSAAAKRRGSPDRVGLQARTALPNAALRPSRQPVTSSWRARHAREFALQDPLRLLVRPAWGRPSSCWFASCNSLMEKGTAASRGRRPSWTSSK